MNKNISISIDQLANGAVAERINAEMNKIADNILDFNTEAKKKRKLTITVEYLPNETRRIVATSIDVKSTLVGHSKAETEIMIERDFNTGMIHANELLSGVPGQMFIDKDGEVRTDIGERVEDIEDESNIVDYNKRKSN